MEMEMGMTKKLSRAELVQQAFDCCQQCVKSYQSGRFDGLDEITSEYLIGMMEQLKVTALRDVAKEPSNG